MAITKIGNPDSGVNPAYNPLVYYFESTNNNEDGFRYIAVIKDTFNNVIFEKTIIPDFDDKKCILNLNRELQDFVSYNLDLSNLDGLNYDADKSYLNFDIEMGEEYVEVWNWQEYGFAGSVNWPNFGDDQINTDGGAKTMLYTTSNTNQPPYVNGDKIFIEANQPQNEPTLAYTGVHKVLDVYNQNGSSGAYWVVVLDLPWVNVSGTSSGGDARYSDFRKTRFTNLLSVNNQSVINTVLSKRDYLNYDSNDYLQEMNNTDVSLLSQLPTEYTIRENNNMFIQYLTYDLNTLEQPRFLKFENDNGDISELTLDTGINTIWGIDVSPTRTDWGTIQTGTLPIVKSNTKWYKISLLDVNGVLLSKEYKLNINRSCDIAESTMEFLWMDKFGSFLPYNFTARNTEKQNITRDNYTKRLGGYNSADNKFDYDLTDGGKEIYNTEYSRRFDLSTDYMKDDDSVFFQNIVHSPVTYLKIDNIWTRCVIDTNSITIKKDNWTERIRYNLSVEISNKENINI